MTSAEIIARQMSSEEWRLFLAVRELPPGSRMLIAAMLLEDAGAVPIAMRRVAELLSYEVSSLLRDAVEDGSVGKV